MKTLNLMVALAVATALGACGGAGDGKTDMTTTDPTIPSPPLLDAFVTAVQALVGDSSDSAEPVAVDSVAVTMPENGEPTTLK